jgi:hypothetical protein
VPPLLRLYRRGRFRTQRSRGMHRALAGPHWRTLPKRGHARAAAKRRLAGAHRRTENWLPGRRTRRPWRTGRPWSSRHRRPGLLLIQAGKNVWPGRNNRSRGRLTH